jgi:pterin-4a-carbinolamine dehydratase
MEKVDMLNKCLEHVSKSQTDFMTKFTELQDFSGDSIKNMDVQIRKKDEECYNKYDLLSKEYAAKVYKLKQDFEKQKYDLEQSIQQQKDEMNREFQQDEYDRALDVLEKKKEVAISEEHYDDISNELKDLKKNQDEHEKKIVKTEEQKWRGLMTNSMKTKDLEFAASSAQMKAEIEQKGKEIDVLHDTIDSLKEEIQEQRKLTKSVAEAGQKQVTQNFSK